MDRSLAGRDLSYLSKDQKMVYSLILRQLQEDGTISSETETQYLDQLGTDSFEEQRENFLGDGEAEQIAALTEEDEVSSTQVHL